MIFLRRKLSDIGVLRVLNKMQLLILSLIHILLPNSGFDRTNVSLSTNSKFGKKLTIDAKVLYSLENNKNRPTLSDSPGNAIQGVWKVPGNIDITSLRGDPNKIGAIPTEGVDPNTLSYWGRIPGEEWQLNPVGDQWSSGPYWSCLLYTS